MPSGVSSFTDFVPRWARGKTQEELEAIMDDTHCQIGYAIPPTRYQRSRKAGAKLLAGTVCVTRPGKWGNPFSDARTFLLYIQLALRNGINPEIKNNPAIEKMQWIADNIEQLRGKDLACWCALDEFCHGDVLLDFANREG